MKLLHRWTLYGVLIGVVAGLGAVIFYGLLSIVTHFTLGSIAGYYPIQVGGEPNLFLESGKTVNRLFLLFILLLGGLLREEMFTRSRQRLKATALTP